MCKATHLLPSFGLHYHFRYQPAVILSLTLGDNGGIKFGPSQTSCLSSEGNRLNDSAEKERAEHSWPHTPLP
uniref:Uncharacterized protein n=1 Tax=Rangifer tarandus platyrhynchus TaxID=3082113 RepID=A0ACB0F5P7_RANTA|nr:unnamed protein product [Rangifer tarandus platyrhynchus]